MCKAILLLAVFLVPLLAQPDRFGLPACSAASQQELLTRSAYTTCYDGSFKAPVWAIHELTPERPPVRITRRHFRRDWSLTVPSASHSDWSLLAMASGSPGLTQPMPLENVSNISLKICSKRPI